MERLFSTLKTGDTFYLESDRYLENPIVKREQDESEFKCGGCHLAGFNAFPRDLPKYRMHFCPDKTVQIAPIVRVYGSKRKWKTVWGFEQITDPDPKDRTDGREYAKFREIGDAMLYLHALCHRPAFYDRLIVIR